MSKWITVIDNPDLLLTCYAVKAFQPGDEILCDGCDAYHTVIRWRGNTLMVDVAPGQHPQVEDSISVEQVKAWKRKPISSQP